MAKDPTGALRIRVKRGINLAIRDICTSDPYVVVQAGDAKAKTKVIQSNCDPEWNQDLTLSISDPNVPVKLTVFDHDKFSKDDAMGEAEIELKGYVECMRLGLGELPVGTAVKKVQPSRSNCLAEESKVVWAGKGKMVQDMVLRLKKVERGEVVVQIEWIPTTTPMSSSASPHPAGH